MKPTHMITLTEEIFGWKKFCRMSPFAPISVQFCGIYFGDSRILLNLVRINLADYLHIIC